MHPVKYRSGHDWASKGVVGGADAVAVADGQAATVTARGVARSLSVRG